MLSRSGRGRRGGGGGRIISGRQGMAKHGTPLVAPHGGPTTTADRGSRWSAMLSSTESSNSSLFPASRFFTGAPLIAITNRPRISARVAYFIFVCFFKVPPFYMAGNRFVATGSDVPAAGSASHCSQIQSAVCTCNICKLLFRNNAHR